jgi:hypothetical protein
MKIKITQQFGCLYWGTPPPPPVGDWESDIPPSCRERPVPQAWVGDPRIARVLTEDDGQVFVELDTRPARFVRLQANYDGTYSVLSDAGADTDAVVEIFAAAGCQFKEPPSGLPIYAQKEQILDDKFPATWVGYEQTGAWAAIRPLIEAGVVIMGWTARMREKCVRMNS